MQTDIARIEQVLIQGDLSQLNDRERTNYYIKVCESLGLNHLTRPFQYLELSGKLVLYATKDCTEQLRKQHRISLTIKSSEQIGDVYIVRAVATGIDGRCDESTGAVPLVKEDGQWETSKTGKRYFAKTGKLIPLTPEELANAVMKAETKAKRRATLSICGLGMLDETEIETISNATPMISATVDQATPKAIAPPALTANPDSSDISVEEVLTALHRKKKSWDEAKPWLNERFGLELQAHSHVSELTQSQRLALLEALSKPSKKEVTS